MHQKHQQIFNPTNILIADGAYDSIPLQKLTEKIYETYSSCKARHVVKTSTKR
jgi:hypothetical protein